MSWQKRWLQPEVFPIIGVIAMATGWSTYVGYKHFAENPDCSIRKRHNPLDDGFNKGPGVTLFTEGWAESRISNESNFRDSSRFRIFGGK